MEMQHKTIHALPSGPEEHHSATSGISTSTYAHINVSPPANSKCNNMFSQTHVAHGYSMYHRRGENGATKVEMARGSDGHGGEGAHVEGSGDSEKEKTHIYLCLTFCLVLSRHSLISQIFYAHALLLPIGLLLYITMMNGSLVRLYPLW